MIIDGRYIDSIPASNARATIRRCLLKGRRVTIRITVDGQQRVLQHIWESHASAIRLPWPFSLLLIHDVSLYRTTPDGRTLDFDSERRFSRKDIDLAIEEFLKGSNRDDMVGIGAEF